MASASPPSSPSPMPYQQRPMSAMTRPGPRSNSRMSMSSSKAGGAGGSRASDEDSRTAVRVAVRVRPPFRPTDPGYDLIPQRFQRSMVHITTDTNIAIDSPQGRKLFVFDRVFAEDVTQDGIWAYLEDSVNSFLQGYNVSLLAYGQSGAGKSHTMGTAGPLDYADTESMGVIPRAATALFEKLDPARRQRNRSSMSQLRGPTRTSLPAGPSERGWSLTATYLEIYNEQLRDLLLPESVPPHERAAVTIREDTKGNILLTGLRQVDIGSVEDLMNALSFGSSIRQTDATAVNAKSSRSHAVFSLNLVQRRARASETAAAAATPTAATATSRSDKRLSVPLEAMTAGGVISPGGAAVAAESWVTTDSKLHFVDLAGSERLKNTGAQGERAREGISINAGLAALGKVISQLSSRQPGAHVSYRDSKLTRLLQDSLGGNAITYMIACVTPAEFHLGETLNTVQYAQRARAIQSKPRIQQIEDTGDRQAVIDRLKAEVAFLREQIRASAERRTPSGGGGGGGPRPAVPPDRADRMLSEREVELQNQLLDTQENYNNLSQRHARLIAELARAREEEAAAEPAASGESADERMHRSNSFAQAVEQVVLEYEKTIQSLEQSLSSTRSTLSSTEASLLEKETKCAYADTINAQLQSRLQKLMDREASTEHYLHDLEARLDGHSSGEERSAAMTAELRKEITRARENEASCEDYISTLEERLAEADQDAELMQREIDRLEHVIERQRSLGKLDSLLHELDHMQQRGPPQEQQPDQTRVEGEGGGEEEVGSGGSGGGAASTAPVTGIRRHMARPSVTDAIPEEEEAPSAYSSAFSTKPSSVAAAAGPDADVSNARPEPRPASDDTARPRSSGSPVSASTSTSTSGRASATAPSPSPSPTQAQAQTRIVVEKLETVTQELVGLRVEHETTLQEYDQLQSKYEEALRAVAEMRDAMDEARHHHHGQPHKGRSSIVSAASPDSFLSESRSGDLKDGSSSHGGAGGRFSAPRSLSSELSSALDSPATADTTAVDIDADAVTLRPDEDSADLLLLLAEVERLKGLAASREAAERELVARYAALEGRHSEALDEVEELRTEIAKERAAEVMTHPQGPVIRRKSSQNVMIIDRAHRSFASLRNIASENFENQPDLMQGFEINLNAAMHELHARSERIQELEADIASAKRELESKAAMITGLTRERNSLKSSPMDLAVASGLRDRLERSEAQLRDAREAHEAQEARERNLTAALHAARAELGAQRSRLEAAAAAVRPHRKMMEDEEEESGMIQDRDGAVARASTARIVDLEAELQQWESRHRNSHDRAQAAEAEFRARIEGLEEQLAAAEATRANSSKTDGRHQSLVTFLRTEIDEYKAMINSNAARIAELEEQHAAAHSAAESAAADAASHAELAAQLGAQLADAREAYDALKTSHRAELDQVRTTEQRGYEQQAAVLLSEHADAARALEAEAIEAREDLMKVATQVAFALGLDVSADRLTGRIDDLIADHKALAEEQRRRTAAETRAAGAMIDLDRVRTALAEVLGLDQDDEKAGGIITDHHLERLRKRAVELRDQNNRNTRIVQQLEEQLASNFDEAKATSNRLSTLTERNAMLEEAHAAQDRIQNELDSIREDYAILQNKYNEILPHGHAYAVDPQINVNRSNSISGQNGGFPRKSSSVTSLPSPPPSMPLPPLPRLSTSPVPGALPTTPTHGHNRPGSKDQAALAQIQEDQEARISSIEKSLKAEKTLNHVLEESLTELESKSHKLSQDCDGWRTRAQELETEIKVLRERERAAQQQQKQQQQQQQSQQDARRLSMMAAEEERLKREAADTARRRAEERMQSLSQKKKKKTSLNCF